jgi:hypothetical protein
LFQAKLSQIVKQESSVRERWPKIQMTLMKTSEELLDQKSTDTKERITEDTWNKIKQRKGIKDKIHNSKNKEGLRRLRIKYNEANTAV